MKKAAVARMKQAKERVRGTCSFVASIALVFLAAAALALAGASAARADHAAASVPGELIVRFDVRATAAERSAALRRHDARVKRVLPFPGMRVVQLPPRAGVRAAAAVLARERTVVYAQPNYLRELAPRIPNDPFFGHLWGLNNLGDRDIDAPEAWDLTVGREDVVLAVVDSGVAYDHPDLAPNIWRNAGEVVNGLDDDRNGYPDDTVGWDFVAEDSAPLDEEYHGTHVAGTAGAQGNNATGVVGVSWELDLMALRAGDAEGSLSDAHVIEAFGYARAKGARVVNGSFGGPGHFPHALAQSVSASPNTLFVFAAGNEGADNEVQPQWPCNFAYENVVCVAATDQNDNLAQFSNYGATTVDLGAPGVHILSTVPLARVPTGYAFLDGTSMAAPHVSGVAALMLAVNPSLTPSQLRTTILATVDPTPGLAGNVVSGGRLNAFRAVAAVAPPPPPPPVVNGRTCTVWPASNRDGDNYLAGTSGDDVICAFGGNDRVEAGAGADIVYGGAGGDTVLGGFGGDRLYGQAGGDTIRGADGSDRIFGGGGGDRLEGNSAGDYVSGGAGGDFILGWAANDTIVGGGGRDTLSGMAGNDRFYARDKLRDVVRGGAGTDSARLDAVDSRTSVERRF